MFPTVWFWPVFRSQGHDFALGFRSQGYGSQNPGRTPPSFIAGALLLHGGIRNGRSSNVSFHPIKIAHYTTNAHHSTSFRRNMCWFYVGFVKVVGCIQFLCNRQWKRNVHIIAHCRTMTRRQVSRVSQHGLFKGTRYPIDSWLVMWTSLGVCRFEGSLFEPRFLSQWCIFGKYSLAKGIFFLQIFLGQGYIFFRSP